MKRKITVLLSFLALIITISSCTVASDDYLNEYEIRRLIEQAIKENNKDLEFTQWKIVPYEIKKNDWKWNEQLGQYEVFRDIKDLTKFIYEEGAALGYVYLGTQNVDEVQKILPYVETHYGGEDTNGNPIIFTETISCDFQLGNPSTVGFFIKSSDLFPDSEAQSNYNFRIVLIW